MTAAEILAKLPEPIRAKVEPYINFLLTIPDEEITLAVEHWKNSEFLKAYKILVMRMSGAELDLAMEQTNAEMKAAKIRLSNRDAANRIFVTGILLTVWQFGKALMVLGLAL